MFAPDSMIIEDFKQWLKGARSVFNMPTKNLFSDANMASWARNQILAFIDLNIWARYEGVTITDAVMGNTLFPDEIDIDATERIRKTIRAKADYLMRPSVISAIYKQHHCCPVNFHSKGI